MVKKIDLGIADSQYSEPVIKISKTGMQVCERTPELLCLPHRSDEYIGTDKNGMGSNTYLDDVVILWM